MSMVASFPVFYCWIAGLNQKKAFLGRFIFLCYFVSVSAGGRYKPLGVWPLINEKCHAHFR